MTTCHPSSSPENLNVKHGSCTVGPMFYTYPFELSMSNDPHPFTFLSFAMDMYSNVTLQNCLQVDDFELAEETPEKVQRSSKARTPVTASPNEQEPQVRLSRPVASAEQRAVERIAALSPVVEHEEPTSVSQLTNKVGDASPCATGRSDLKKVRCYFQRRQSFK